MKMHILTVAVLAALASRAVLAASEGGDTWSAVKPVQQAAYSVLQPVAPAPDAAFEGSEGGDTWSSLQAVRETTAQQASIQDRPGCWPVEQWSRARLAGTTRCRRPRNLRRRHPGQGPPAAEPSTPPAEPV